MRYFWGKDQAVLLWGKIKQYFCGEIYRKGEMIMWVQPKRGGAKGRVSWFIPDLCLLHVKRSGLCFFSHSDFWVHFIISNATKRVLKDLNTWFGPYSCFSKKHHWSVITLQHLLTFWRNFSTRSIWLGSPDSSSKSDSLCKKWPLQKKLFYHLYFLYKSLL